MATVGVLALQGGIAPHAFALRRAGHRVREVRAPGDLEGLEGLVLPGGESTTQLGLIDRAGMRAPLERFLAGGHPVLATCAGMILLARKVTRPEQDSLGALDIEVTRNGWGRQVESFEALADDGRTGLVFIRAPRITEVGRAVEVLLRYEGEPVLAKQGRIYAASYHPELTDSLALHVEVFGGVGTTADTPDP